MSMKGTGWKQLALSIAGALLCRISIMGCYPFVSAFYAAVYLEEQGRWLLSVGMLAGMIAFLPITVIAKYAMALLIIGITVRMSEWVDKRCYTVVAALAASGGTLALSIFGGIFDIHNQVTAAAAVFEAVFGKRRTFIFRRKRSDSRLWELSGWLSQTAPDELCGEF